MVSAHIQLLFRMIISLLNENATAEVSENADLSIPMSIQMLLIRNENIANDFNYETAFQRKNSQFELQMEFRAQLALLHSIR